jgi:hypothetical protein
LSPSAWDITEIGTALGMLAPSLSDAFASRPAQLRNVPDAMWDELRSSFLRGENAALYTSAFANGRFFLGADEGLRGRLPRLVEWKGRHRVPGDDAIPADLRVDRVYLISCKYLSKILLNPGPARLFDRGLLGDERSGADWFHEVSPVEYQAFYEAAVRTTGLDGVPARAAEMTTTDRAVLRDALRARQLPDGCRGEWRSLCAGVASASASRWDGSLTTPRARLEVFWRMLRISGSTYFVLGVAPSAALRIRVASKWDWLQEYELRSLEIAPRPAGQPEVEWIARIRRRLDRADIVVRGHVEIRWSHGRFQGFPESKVYLDTPHVQVPGYHQMVTEPENQALWD